MSGPNHANFYGFDVSVVIDYIFRIHYELYKATGVEESFRISVPPSYFAALSLHGLHRSKDSDTLELYTPGGRVYVSVGTALPVGADIAALNLRIKELETTLQEIDSKGEPF